MRACVAYQATAPLFCVGGSLPVSLVTQTSELREATPSLFLFLCYTELAELSNWESVIPGVPPTAIATAAVTAVG